MRKKKHKNKTSNNLPQSVSVPTKCNAITIITTLQRNKKKRQTTKIITMQNQRHRRLRDCIILQKLQQQQICGFRAFLAEARIVDGAYSHLGK